MKPYLSKNDENMFYKHLNNINTYFEYGSGGSTYQASIRNNITNIYSVESDIQWQNKLKNIITHPKINYIYNEMNTLPNTWGHPGKNATDENKRRYSDRILELNTNEQQQIDLVFIDGRFRVSCCLKCYDVIRNDCIIVFDDFLNRPQYHIVLDYFDIIEKTNDNRMVILKKNKYKNTKKYY